MGAIQIVTPTPQRSPILTLIKKKTLIKGNRYILILLKTSEQHQTHITVPYETNDQNIFNVQCGTA